jgi:hypothetical protein
VFGTATYSSSFESLPAAPALKETGDKIVARQAKSNDIVVSSLQFQREARWAGAHDIPELIGSRCNPSPTREH